MRSSQTKKRLVKYVCASCGERKAPTLFPRDDPHTCLNCTAELAASLADAENTENVEEQGPVAHPSALKVLKLAPEPEAPAPPVAEALQAGDVFVSPAVSPSVAGELAARTLARRRLLPFIKRFRPKYQAGWVHEDICRRLERFVEQVEKGQEPRLLLCMPVRHGKSEIASRHFAPWVLGRHPDWEIIAASGAQSLAMSFSRYIRDLVRDPAYQSVFANMRLDPSSQSVENWNTTYGGGYLAAGIGTMITGRGAHCVVPYCTVDTPRGRIPASKLRVGDAVYGYDHTTHTVVTTTVKAVSASVRHASLVAVKNGPVVTADHRIYNAVSQSYQDASLSHELPGLWLSESATRADMLGVLLEEQNLDEHRAQLCVLRQDVRALSSGAPENFGQSWAERADILRARVLHALQTRATALVQRCKGLVSAVRSTCGWKQPEKVLFERLLRSVSFSEPGQAGVQWGVPCFEGGGFTARQDLRTVLEAHDAHGSSSHRPRRDEQRHEELGSAVHPVSQKVSHLHGVSAEILAQSLSSDDFCVDLQTGTENFFAAGLLVHNCLIIDDPVKDAEAADSQVIRDAVWEWYMSTAITRLAPGGGVLGIMTMWNEDDWSGRIQQVMASGDGDKFEIVKYPAINEHGDEFILSDDTIVEIPSGEAVPEGARLTRAQNSALHPERYTLEMLLKRKANYYALGQQRWWAALYQQNPTPEDGSFFTKDMFVEYVHAPQRQGRVVYQAWDFAITEKQASDYTVAITVLVDENDIMFVLDVWRFRSDDGTEISRAIMTYARLWEANVIAVEDGQIWKSIKSNFERSCAEAKYYPPYEVIVPLTDKRTRAQPARGRMQQKKIQFPARAPWYAEFKAELLRFQAGGRHDDQVDALAHVVRIATSHAAPKGPPQPKMPESWKKKLLRSLHVGSSHMCA